MLVGEAYQLELLKIFLVNFDAYLQNKGHSKMMHLSISGLAQ